MPNRDRPTQSNSLRLLLLLALVAARPVWAADIYLPPIAFSPASRDTDFSIDQGGMGCLRVNRFTGFFIAALPLSEGSVLEEATVFVEDANPDALGMMSLARRHETAFEVLAVTPPSRGGGEIEALPVSMPASITSNSGERLLLQVLLTGPDVCLHGARIKVR